MTTPLHIAHREALAEAERLAAQIEKLSRATQSSSPAVVELAQLHADHQAAVEAWSAADGEGAIPLLDRKREQKLHAEISAHADSVASAEAALKAIVAKREAIRSDLAKLERNITVAALMTIANEELPRLADALKDAEQALADRTQEYEGLKSSIMSQASLLSAPELSHAVTSTNIIFTRPTAKGSLDAINSRLEALIRGDA